MSNSENNRKNTWQGAKRNGDAKQPFEGQGEQRPEQKRVDGQQGQTSANQPQNGEQSMEPLGPAVPEETIAPVQYTGSGEPSSTPLEQPSEIPLYSDQQPTQPEKPFGSQRN